MDQQRIDAEIDAARELLATVTSGHLSYVAADGTPRVVPVGVWWTGTEIVVATGEHAPKVAALRAAPAVALALEGVGASGVPEQARALSLRGLAEVTVVDGVVLEYLEAARRSMPPEAAAAFEAECRATYPRMARIAVRPTWARYFDFGTGRVPGFLAELLTHRAHGPQD